MLQLKNTTPFAAALMLLPDRDGVDTLFTVVKGTFTIGQSFSLAEKQVPVALADEHYGEPDATSIRVPSDVALDKQATDVLLVGSAHAPDGKPVWQMDVSLAVGPVSRTVRVFGDRVWNVRAGVSEISWVAPFTQMPLVWERAYGGGDRTEKGPAAEARNPVGVGFRTSGGLKPLAGSPLPNVEDPATLITSSNDKPRPAGFAPIAAHWEPRRQFAGTYDAAWQKERAPYLPHDFDSRFFQLAPPDLVAPGFLQGGELVDIRGVTPDGILRFLLPTVRVHTTYRFADSRAERPAHLDTVIIEPEQSRLVMLWRASLPCDKKALKVHEVEAALHAAGQNS